MTKIAESICRSGSGFTSRRHGSADPDPHKKCHGSATLILTQKNGFQAFGNMIRVFHLRIRILIFYPSWIPDPVVEKAPDSGSGIGIRNIGRKCSESGFQLSNEIFQGWKGWIVSLEGASPKTWHFLKLFC